MSDTERQVGNNDLRYDDEPAGGFYHVILRDADDGDKIVVNEDDLIPLRDRLNETIAKSGQNPFGMTAIDSAVNALVGHVHQLNKTWWRDPATGEPKKRNFGELLMLAVSELAEAMEGDRKSLPDDKLPHRPMREVELADCVIRILDMAGGLGMTLGGALQEKLEYNRNRADHKPENRVLPGGKSY